MCKEKMPEGDCSTCQRPDGCDWGEGVIIAKQRLTLQQMGQQLEVIVSDPKTSQTELGEPVQQA